MRCAQLKEGETIEDLQNGFFIIQNKKFFSFGTDAVLLAHFAAARAGDRVVDLGTGCGIIPVLLCARQDMIHITGIEVVEELAQMAQRSVELNALCHKIAIVCGDLKIADNYVDKGVDLVVANPPYIKTQAGALNENKYHNIAKREIACTLEDVICAAAKLLRSGGRLCMVYTATRIAELIVHMKDAKIEPKIMQFVTSFHGKAPNFVLIEGRKGAGQGVRFLPMLEVYESPGVYTKMLKKIYGC